MTDSIGKQVSHVKLIVVRAPAFMYNGPILKYGGHQYDEMPLG